MAKIFAKIQNYMKKVSVTVTDIEGRFVLPEAYEQYQKGYLLKDTKNSKFYWGKLE